MESAESVIISACLNEKLILDIRTRVKPEFFKDQVLGSLCEKLLAFYSRNSIVPTQETVKELVKSEFNTQEQLLLNPVINGLSADIDESLVKLRIEELIKNFRIRKYESLGSLLTSKKISDPAMLETKTYKALSDIKALTDDDISIIDLTHNPDAAVKIEASYETGHSPEEGGSLFCNVKEIDEMTGGGRKGELWLYLGATGHGKTTMLMNHAYHLAVNMGVNVIYVTVEMPTISMMQYFSALHAFRKFGATRMDTRDIRSHNLDDETRAKWAEATEDLANNPDYGMLRMVQVKRHNNIVDVAMITERIQNEFDVHAIFIDYLTRLSAISRRGQMHEEIDESVKAAKHFALDHNKSEGIFVCTAHQPNDSGRSRAIKNDGVYDTRAVSGSKEAANSADVMVSIFKACELGGEKAAEQAESGLAQDDGELLFSVIKNRHGPPSHRFSVYADLKARSVESSGSVVDKLHFIEDEDTDIGVEL